MTPTEKNMRTAINEWLKTPDVSLRRKVLAKIVNELINMGEIDLRGRK